MPQVQSSTTDLPKLYPPGRILHIVRQYPTDRHEKESAYESFAPPVYQIIENDNKHFDELLISPRMIQDHMPDNLIKCMRAVLDEPLPKKSTRSKDEMNAFCVLLT